MIITSLGRSRTSSMISASLVCILAAGLAVATTSTAIATSSAAPAATAVTSRTDTRALTSSCAWPIITNAQKVNVAYPDTDATYWTTPYRVEPGTRFIVKGTFPNARFMSFNTYDSTGGAFTTNNVPGAIFDYQISPNPGSTNPYQHTARRSRKLRGDVISSTSKSGFKVRVQSDVPGSQPNTIPSAPAGTAAGSIGFLLMRVYLPKGANFNAIKLPSISIITAAGTRTITPCSPKKQKSPKSALSGLDPDMQAAIRNIAARLEEEGNPATGPISTPRASSAPSIKFARATAATTNSVFPNSASAYVSALFTPNPNRVVLVRAKAPRTPALKPPGTQPLPWPTKKYQLRYFSLCNNIYRKPWPVVINKTKGGGTDLGCRADNATKLDSLGRYTYVVAPQSKKNQVTRWANTTFVPTSIKSKTDQEVLIFRNMLSNSAFKKSAANAPQNDQPAGAAAAMGEYYPRAVSCPTTYYLANGPSACFKKY